MRLYPESNIVIDSINLAMCRPYKDFGRGVHYSNRQRELPGEFKEALQEIEQKMKKIRLKGSFGKRMMEEQAEKSIKLLRKAGN